MGELKGCVSIGGDIMGDTCIWGYHVVDICMGDICMGDICLGDICMGDICVGDICVGDVSSGDYCTALPSTLYPLPSTSRAVAWAPPAGHPQSWSRGTCCKRTRTGTG